MLEGFEYGACFTALCCWVGDPEYLPLAQYPPGRLAFILQDSRATVLLTEQRLLPSLPDHAARVVCLDTEWQIVAEQDRENL